jgi:Gpi18-like mannosyltransferase
MSKFYIFLLLLAGVSVRLLAFQQIDFAFRNDIAIFEFWAAQLAEHGFEAFYAADFFSDYPPGFLYILAFVGRFREEEFFRFLIFLPAILCDIAIGFVVYFLAAKKNSQKFALAVTAAWLFNPAIILISSVLGTGRSFVCFDASCVADFFARKKIVAGVCFVRNRHFDETAVAFSRAGLFVFGV